MTRASYQHGKSLKQFYFSADKGTQIEIGGYDFMGLI